jgi:pimeloyl-ACP methyl ester carboxylesterase
MDYTPNITETTVQMRTMAVAGLNIFYREAGRPGSPQVVLLHGFPASSHQYRNLIPALADKFHVLAMDYPGFGNSDMPDPAHYAYTFDRISEVVEAFLKSKKFTRFGLFMQDYGGPVGFRILTRHPDWLQWLAIQNTNAYEAGFTAVWEGFRNALWKNRTPETEKPLLAFLELAAIQTVYLHGHKKPDLISPDNWNMDFRFMERPYARRVQMELFYDYRTNVTLYPTWQKFLRSHQPKTIIFWGQDDIFFTREGGEAYLQDLPNAEMHRLDSGHFAVEDCLDYIAASMQRFYDEKVAAGPQVQAVAAHGGRRQTGSVAISSEKKGG